MLRMVSVIVKNAEYVLVSNVNFVSFMNRFK